MVRVDYGGLERGLFVEMIELMLSTINCFASHGIGRLVEKISKVAVNFAKIYPMRPSYLPLQNYLKKQNFNLVNIETKTRTNVFRTAFLQHTI